MEHITIGLVWGLRELLTNHDCMNNILTTVELFLSKEDQMLPEEETFKFLLETTDDGFTALEHVMVNTTNSDIANKAQTIIESYLDENEHKM